ncbi:MAG: FG-GAP repeat protein [Alphaproteobacteria bacterium]|nr:FG-GAP repeat protein [Alphaproteobacteria bacterium]
MKLLLLFAACTWLNEDDLAARLDRDGDGHQGIPVGDDCDDDDADAHPGAEERCGGGDEDCDGTVDETPVDAAAYYRDSDGDGFGLLTDAVFTCSAPTGYVANSDDCDDGDADINPDGVEVCDDVDNDCDGDADGDATDAGTWYPDLDGDTYGDDDGAVLACDAPEDHVSSGGDCDDSSAAVAPNLVEICNDGLDNDCSGDAPECVLGGVYDVDALGVTVTGQGGDFGEALVGGDFNGDGDGDIVIGAPTKSNLNKGNLYIFYGPLTASVDGTAADDRIIGVQSPGYVGLSLANVGDIDGDGADDLLVGARSVSNHLAFPGGAYLLHGAELPSADLNDPPAVIYGAANNDRAGVAVAGPGDYTGDGVPDLLITATRNDDAAEDAGAVCLVDGTVNGDSSLQQAEGCLRGEEAGDELGARLVVLGDVDGDGRDDFAVSSLTHSAKGAVWMVPDMRTNFNNIRNNAKLVGERDDDAAGTALGAPGDVDGDGLADLLVGAPGSDRATSDAGAAYLVLGSTWADSGLTEALADMSQVIFVGESAQDFAGTAVGATDLDGQGAPDLVISSPTNSTSSATAGGRVYVFMDSAALVGEVDLSEADLKIDGTEDAAQIGLSLTGVSDVNGDPYGDLLIGAPYQGGTSAGAVHLVFGAGQ